MSLKRLRWFTPQPKTEALLRDYAALLGSYADAPPAEHLFGLCHYFGQCGAGAVLDAYALWDACVCATRAIAEERKYLQGQNVPPDLHLSVVIYWPARAYMDATGPTPQRVHLARTLATLLEDIGFLRAAAFYLENPES